MSRRAFLGRGATLSGLVATGGLGALVAACGGPGDTTAAEPGEDFTGALRLLLGSHMGPVNQLAERYEAEHGFAPTVEEATTPDLRSVLTTAFLAQQSPWDAAFTTSVVAQEMASRNWAVPAGPFIDQSVRSTGEPFESAMTPVTYDGEVYAVPWTVGAPIMFWNRALFEQADLDPDAPLTWHEQPNSWDAFVDAAKALTGERDGVQHWGFTDAWADDHKLYTWGALLQMHGGRFLDDDGNPAFDTDAGVEATMKMYELLHTHQVVDPAVETYTWVFDASPGFLNGSRAMFFTWPFIAGVAEDPEQSDVGGQVGFAPQPAVDTSASVDGSEYLFLPRFGDNADEAWRFLELVTSVDGQRAIASEGWAPIYADLATDPELLEDFPVYEAVAQSYGYPVDGGFSPDREVWADILAGQISEVLGDAKSAEEALADAVRLIEQERDS